jgi:transcriptional regulator GlxA family with amidase domain
VTPLSTTAALRHADVIAAIRRGSGDAVIERAVDNLVDVLVADALAHQEFAWPASRVALVDRVRVGHAVDPHRSLGDLTHGVASMGHVSRTFQQGTGMSFREYRAHLRAITALRRLANGGAHDGGLAGLAARTGYADHAHLTRSVRKSFGHSPAELVRRFDG